MQYRTLGRTGVEVSELGFGGAGAGLDGYLKAWDPATEARVQSVERALARAVELGINYFDTAPKYGSEEMFGRGLEPYRDRIFLATKAWAWDADGVRKSLEESLVKLRTDHVDLIQLHGDWFTDEVVREILRPGRGALAGLQALKRDGLARFIGFTSEGANGPVSQLIETGEFDVMQIQYNIMFQHPFDPAKQAGVLAEAEEQGMGIAIMRPFTGGTLTRWLKLIAPGLDSQADFYGAMLSFVLSNPLVDVAIAGMRSVQRVETNCAIADDTASRIDLDALYSRHLRGVPGSDEEVWVLSAGR